jgi:hypothetical protein
MVVKGATSIVTPFDKSTSFYTQSDKYRLPFCDDQRLEYDYNVSRTVKAQDAFVEANAYSPSS